eukprot:COSAG02_NODE_18393_length_941_cov_2.149644_1_plen_92_part_10
MRPTAPRAVHIYGQHARARAALGVNGRHPMVDSMRDIFQDLLNTEYRTDSNPTVGWRINQSPSMHSRLRTSQISGHMHFRIRVKFCMKLDQN